MWSCRSRAGRWQEQRSPLAPGARVRLLREHSQAEPASRAGFRPRDGLSPGARSIPALQALPDGLPDPAARAGRDAWTGQARLRDAAVATAHSVVPADVPAGVPVRAGHFVAAQARHPDRTAPAEPVDSMEVPGRFCLWILRYWDRVWSVFSCCCSSWVKAFASTRIPYSAMALQIMCTPAHSSPMQLDRGNVALTVENLMRRQRIFVYPL
jgi:hypothetical protein